MKSNHILRKFLLVAILSISFCPADSSYAIDPNSCDSIILEPFLDAILQRVSTLAKFVSLNLGNNNRRDPAKNPQGWSYDGYVQTQVELLMGGAWDAYVFSAETILSSLSHTCYSKGRCLLRAAAQSLLSKCSGSSMKSRLLTP